MHGIGFVKEKIVVEADLLAQITPKNKLWYNHSLMYILMLKLQIM
jgi:hypothetical protein